MTLASPQPPLPSAVLLASELLTSSNPVMDRVLRLAYGVAPTPATVLISGESGTGKEVLARVIHDASERRHRPFVAINCGALPASLIESELFGHERGAFSGATERRVGRFEAAEGGTLLLDEISEMPIELQTRFLRVLQEREVHRVGASSPTAVDVRVVATTNRDLRQLVDDGCFREDLYYRVHVFPIHVPPLRHRMEDIPALCETLLARLGRRFRRDGVMATPAALDALAAWHWPGNVRELSNALERALILAGGHEIGPEHIVVDAQRVEGPILAPSPMAPAAGQGGDSLQDLEQQAILQVLLACDGNRTHAADRLGISIRTLRNRLRDYRKKGIPVPAPSGVRRALGTVDAPRGAQAEGDPPSWRSNHVAGIR